MNKFFQVLAYLLDRLGESSTWQGVGFFVGMFYSSYRDLEWGAGVGIGCTISGLIKIFLPDKFKKNSE